MQLLEDLILRFLSKAPYADLKEAFHKLRKDLLSKQSEILSATVLHHFHFLAWIQAHLDKRLFSEVYQEMLKL